MLPIGLIHGTAAVCEDRAVVATDADRGGGEILIGCDRECILGGAGAMGGVAGALVNLERYQLGLDYYRTYPDLVRGISSEMVLETSRRYLDPDRLGIAIAGPE